MNPLTQTLQAEDWEKIRTCSRVAGDLCTLCRGETYFAHWYNSSSKLTLCESCYKINYFPEQTAAEKAARKKENQERDALIADEKQRRQRGEPPPEGWKRRDNLLVATQPVYIFGVPYYEIIEIYPTLFDTETIKSSDQPLTSFFQPFKKDLKNP